MLDKRVGVDNETKSVVAVGMIGRFVATNKPAMTTNEVAVNQMIKPRLRYLMLVNRQFPG